MNFNLPDKKYRVIYADPPWSFNSKNTGGSMKSGALNYYPTMTMDQMKSMPIKELADDNCLLAMWYVSSQPQEALDLIKAWGFTLRNFNGFVWGKQTVKGNPEFGMGYYTRAGVECCAFATIGKPSEIIVDHSVRQLRMAINEKHSKKPQEFRDDLVQLCGDVPRIELFARNKTDGWDVWGNEV